MPLTRAAILRLIAWIVGIGVLIVATGPSMPDMLRRLGDISLHTPNWALWERASWIVKLHVASALAAFVIGSAILLQRKGSGLHKTLGWAWVFAMASTAISSLWITGLNGDSWSLVHLLSGWTIIALPMGVWAIRNRKVQIHRRAMTGMFVGGLLVAGALTFIPGRIMFETFFG
ncbi:MAG: DUF2306 domain-containing protein [Hyphomonadaceae bacterium]|nr:DUF2306 domain-containing protein [Hyphomonadaceae bacterium]